MSIYQGVNDFLIETLANQAEVADEIRVNYASLNDVPESQRRLDYLIYITTSDTYYRWDPTLNGGLGDWEVAINPASGTILSVNPGNQTNITGTLQNPIVNVSTTPSFNTITLTTQTAINHATRKDYVDTADTTLQTNITNLDNATLKKASNLSDVNNVPSSRQNLGLGDTSAVTNGQVLIGHTANNNFSKATISGTAGYVNVQNGAGTITIDLQTQTKNKIDGAIQTVSSSEPNIITINSADPNNIIVNPQIAFGDGPKYTVANSANSAGNITTSNNADFATATTISLNYQPLNRFNDLTYVKNYLTKKLADSFPMTLHLFNVANTDVAEFYLTSFNTIGANSVTFNCQFDAGASTVTTYANGVTIQAFFGNVNKNYNNTDGHITINTTSIINPTINIQDDFNRRAGAYNGFRFFYGTTLSTAGHFATNSATTSAVTQMSIGTAPVNRTLIDVDDITYFLQYMERQLPFRIRIINTTLTTSYVDYLINSFLGTGSPSHRLYGVSYVAGATMATFPANNTRCLIYFDDFDQASSTRTTATGTYITASNVQTNLSSLDTGLNAHVISSTAHSASNITSTSQSILTGTNVQSNLTTINNYLNLMNKNTLQNASIQILNFNTSNPNSNSDNMAFDANGNFSYNSPQSILAFNRGVFISLPSPKKVIQDAVPEINFMCLQLNSSGWQNRVNGLQNVMVGFTTQATMETVENWLSSNLVAGYTGVWAVGATAKEKVIRARFFGTGVEFVYGAVNAGTRTGTTSVINSLQNDVLVFYLSKTMNFTIELRRSGSYGTVTTAGTIAHPDGTGLNKNFNMSPLVPCFSIFPNIGGIEVKVLSKRETDSLGITVSGGVNIFA